MCKAMGKVILFGFIGLAISWAALYYRYSDEKAVLAKKFRLDPPPKLEGPLAVSNNYKAISRLLEAKITGPESLVVTDNAIYATIYEAKVIKIVDNQIKSEISYSERAKFFRDCGNFDSEPTCGRPLGIRRLNENSEKFIVLDAYLGIFLIDFTDDKNPTSSQLFDSKTPINGLTPKFLNDFDVINEDELIISDSSTKYGRRNFMAVVLEHNADGRIIHFKISTKTATVLLDKLYFPNGVQLLPDKKSIIFSECSMARIKKLTIDSKKVEMFTSNLPGVPDNIRKTSRNTYWVGLGATRHSSSPSLLDKLGSLPGIRQFLIDIIPQKFWETLLHVTKKSHSIIVEIDGNGKIIRSIHDVNGQYFGDVSQVNEHNNILYLGSFNSPYIAKIEL